MFFQVVIFAKQICQLVPQTSTSWKKEASVQIKKEGRILRKKKDQEDLAQKRVYKK